jgi:hypothetical protein
MKTRRNSASPFGTTIFLKKDEIDDICEAALREAKVLPEKPSPVKIDHFIESYFKCSLDFGTELGDGTIGFTLFSKIGAPIVVGVSPELCDGSKINERRIRTTLAHEGGHCLMHPILFMPDNDKSSLFGTNVDITNNRVLCRKQDFEKRGYDGRWWEVQANAAIGGFLLPKCLFKRAVEPFLEQAGSLGLKEIPLHKRDQVAREVAEFFDVNPQVVSIRLDQFFPASTAPML